MQALVKIQFFRRKGGLGINAETIRHKIAMLLVMKGMPREWQQEWDVDSIPRGASKAVEGQWLKRFHLEFPEILEAVEVCEPVIGVRSNEIIVTQTEQWLGMDLFPTSVPPARTNWQRDELIRRINTSLSSSQRSDSFTFIRGWEAAERDRRERSGHRSSNNQHLRA